MSRDEQENKFKKFLMSENTVKGLFIASVASISALVSFSFAFSSTKKRDNTVYDNAAVELHASGAQLALRALKWGTFFAVSGCGLIIFGFWKLANVKDMKEFRQKMGSLIPAVPKNYPPQSKTDFASVTEFLRYLDEEYSSNKTNESNVSPVEDISKNSSQD